MAEDTAGRPLGYAARPAGRTRWRRWAVRAALVLVLGTVAALAWRYHDDVRARAELLYWQRQSMTFLLTPETVVYDEHPDTVGALWAADQKSGAGNYEAEFTGRWHKDEGESAADVRTVEYCRLPNDNIGFFGGLNGFAVCGSLLLHERRAEGGEARLVSVSPAVSWHSDGIVSERTGLDFEVQVLRPATWFRRMEEMEYGSVSVIDSVPVPRGRIRYYAGRPDPADESRFSFDYETPAGRGTIDGWLTGDDTIEFEVRDGPLAQQDDRPAAE